MKFEKKYADQLVAIKNSNKLPFTLIPSGLIAG